MESLHEAAFIIFSGFNQRALIAFCRVLTKYKIPYFIIALSETDPIMLTEYKAHVAAVRKRTELVQSDLEEQIQVVRERYSYPKYYILPSSEALNRHLLKYRSRLEQLGVHVPLVREELYQKISDKYAFGELCAHYGIKVPEEVEVTDNTAFPVIVKPKTYFTRDGRVCSPIFVYSRRELVEFFDQGFHAEDFYVQQYIDGESYYLLYHISKNGECLSFSQKNLIQQGGGKSIIAAIPSDLHNQEISRTFERMLVQEGFNGLIMFEIRSNGDSYYVIEANPRLWGPSQFAVDCNVPLFEAFIQDLGFKFHREPSALNMNATYFWMGGLVNSLEKVVYHGISPETFLSDIAKFLPYEIYLRPDTWRLSLLEFRSTCE